MSIETKPRTTEKYDLPTHIKPQQRGFMNVYEQDGTERAPGVQVNIHQGDRRNGFQAKPHRGIYAFGPLAKNKSAFPLKISRGVTRNADIATKSLVEQSALVPDMTKLVFSDEGIVFYQPENGYTTLVKTADEEPQTSKIMTLTGDPETHVGRYNPERGDIIYIVRNRDAELFLTPPYEDDIATDRLRDEDVQFATFEVTSEQVEAMAAARRQAARSKESIDRRRIETVAKLGKLAGSRDITEGRAAVVNEPENRAMTEPPVVTGTAAAERAGTTVDLIDNEDNELNGQVAAEVATAAIPEDSVAVDTPASSDSSNALARMRAARSTASTTADTAPEALDGSRQFHKSDRYKAALNEYRAADEKLAKGMAVRTKLGIFARRKTRERLDEENDATAEAYFAQSELFEALQVEKWKANNPDITDERITEKLAAYHTAKQRVHAMRTQNEFRDIKKHGKVSEWNDTLLEKYAGLTKKQKIAAGIGAAAALGAVGFAAGAFGVFGAVGMMGAKVYKTYAQNRAGLYAPTQQVETLTTHNEDESGNRGLKTSDDLRTEAREAMGRRQRARTAEVDRINKRTKVAVLASTALIGTGLVTSHLSEIQDVGRKVGDHVSGWWNSLGKDTTDVITAPDVHIDFPRTQVKTIPGPGHVEAPVAPKVPEFSADALRVDAGEGWYQTFNEIGVTNATEQANLLQKVGPELVRRGVAYQMADGSYGISRPGALSKDVLELIQKSR